MTKSGNPIKELFGNGSLAVRPVSISSLQLAFCLLESQLLALCSTGGLLTGNGVTLTRISGLTSELGSMSMRRCQDFSSLTNRRSPKSHSETAARRQLSILQETTTLKLC